jgi:hypothetical protein
MAWQIACSPAFESTSIPIDVRMAHLDQSNREVVSGQSFRVGAQCNDRRSEVPLRQFDDLSLEPLLHR